MFEQKIPCTTESIVFVPFFALPYFPKPNGEGIHMGLSTFLRNFEGNSKTCPDRKYGESLVSDKIWKNYEDWIN